MNRLFLGLTKLSSITDHSRQKVNFSHGSSVFIKPKKEVMQIVYLTIYNGQSDMKNASRMEYSNISLNLFLSLSYDHVVSCSLWK